jgi:hypothetical protein
MCNNSSLFFTIRLIIAWNIHYYYYVYFNLKTISADVYLQLWIGDQRKETNKVDVGDAAAERGD